MSESKDTQLLVESSDEGKGNLKLWRSVEETPPDMTRQVSYGKRSYTTIDPQWQLQRATAIWGPYGVRWGLRNIKYEIRELRYVEKIELQTRDADNKVVQTTEQVADYIRYSIIMSAEFFYPTDDGGEASFEILNDDKYESDADVLKKITTNTRSKALSWLGFSADVFLGKFDDTIYVKDLKVKFGDQDAATRSIAAAIRTAKDIGVLAKCKGRLEMMVANKTISDVESIERLEELIEEREQELL